MTATVIQLKSHDCRAAEEEGGRVRVRQPSISKLPIHKFLPSSFQKAGELFQTQCPNRISLSLNTERGCLMRSKSSLIEI